MATVKEKKVAKPNARADKQLAKLLRAMEALRKGDLTVRLGKKNADIYGELADSYNSMVDTLNLFAGEVTWVAREIGTEGKLGGQADVPGAARTWKDLVDNVNTMASNLTGQVRGALCYFEGASTGDAEPVIRA